MLAKAAEGMPGGGAAEKDKEYHQMRPVMVATQLARHMRKLGLDRTYFLLLMVNAMLFMGALLGLVLVVFGVYFLFYGIDVYQYNFDTHDYQRTITEACLCPGLLAILNSGFFIFKQGAVNRAPIKPRTPVMTFVVIGLLLSELVSAIASMVLSYGTASVLETLEKERFNEGVADQCGIIQLSRCHCEVLYVTGVETCNYVFDSLPTYQSMVAVTSALIVVLVSTCLVIVLSSTLSAVPARLNKEAQRVWDLFRR